MNVLTFKSIHCLSKLDLIGECISSFFNNAMKNIKSRNLLQVAICVHFICRICLCSRTSTLSRPQNLRFQNFVRNTLLCFVLHSYIFYSSFLEYENEILDMHQSQSCSRAYHKKQEHRSNLRIVLSSYSIYIS